ncbi:TonB-dependent receptor [Sphingorhabdus arenilitoris]|uniref:TonB-dependent receptor n=1 Tax=Sphingorhabdus arenilitoris TaxID=1490041 RepID=A0ABV8RHS7_9SPHN
MKIAHRVLKGAMLSTISIAALGAGNIAYAQNNAPADENAEDQADDNSGFGENDIVVTATKREQTLQEIPVAVTVTSAESIEKAQVRDLADLQTIAPTLRVGQLQSSANTNFIIRGFGNGANNAGIEPSVGVFIDGVYRSRSAAQIGDLPNLQRVEVLRGPQSTLFGKNASAGVISIVTREPQYVFGGSVEASYGNFNAIIGKADITGPIADNIAFSLAANYNKRDGYANDLNLGTKVNERNRYGFRGQLLIEPSDVFKIRLIGDYDNINEDCCVAANLFNGPTGAIVNALAGGIGLDAENPFSYNVYTNLPSENRIKNYGGSAQIDYEAGALSLTSITAYRGVDSFSNQDSDFTAADLLQRNINDTQIRTFTQEFRVSSDFDGPFNFLLGGYYFNEKIDVNNDIEYGEDFRAFGNALLGAATGGALNFSILEGAFGASDFAAGLVSSPTAYAGQFFAAGTGYPSEIYTLDNQAYSIFGTVDFDITDRLTLTGGFNYTKDSKDFSSNVTATDAFSAIDFNAPQYATFRRNLLIGGGAPFGLATFLGANPTTTTLPDGVTPLSSIGIANANPLAGLRAFQFQPRLVNFPNSVEDGETRDGKFTYSARLAFEATDSLNLYASYATGFKASSVNLSRDSRPFLSDAAALGSAGLLQPNQSFGTRFAGPENAEVFEIGIKGAWDVAAFNLTLFKQSIKGFQTNIFTGTGFALANAGEQSTDGIEFDGTVSPTDNLTFSAAMVYLNPKYDSYPNSTTGDLTGTRPSGIPALSTSLGVDYDIPIGGDNKLNLHADYYYESKVFLFDDNVNNPAADAFAKANFSRSVNALSASTTLFLDNGLQVSVWGRNLTGAEYITTAFPSVGQAGSFSGYPSQPRTYGVSAKYKF